MYHLKYFKLISVLLINLSVLYLPLSTVSTRLRSFCYFCSSFLPSILSSFLSFFLFFTLLRRYCTAQAEQSESYYSIQHITKLHSNSHSHLPCPLTFTLSRLSAKFFRTSYLTFFVQTRLSLFAKNLSILSLLDSGE